MLNYTTKTIFSQWLAFDERDKIAFDERDKIILKIVCIYANIKPVGKYCIFNCHFGKFLFV